MSEKGGMVVMGAWSPVGLLVGMNVGEQVLFGGEHTHDEVWGCDVVYNQGSVRDERSSRATFGSRGWKRLVASIEARYPAVAMFASEVFRWLSVSIRRVNFVGRQRA